LEKKKKLKLKDIFIFQQGRKMLKEVSTPHILSLALHYMTKERDHESITRGYHPFI
jgi:hypothetical protein